MKDTIKDIKCFLLDLDGTVYLGDRPIGSMAETLGKVRASGRRVVYLTNNSSKTAAEYTEKLKWLKLWADGAVVYTSGIAAAAFLSSEHKGKSVYIVGTDALKDYFRAQGITLTGDNGEQPDIVMLAYDTSLTYQKLVYATRYIALGARYFATHPDVTCPAPTVFLPDTGSFIALIEACTGKRPEAICGKPFGIMGKTVSELLKLSPRQILMVGDRMHTDMAFAVNNGFMSLLVLSGETTRADYAASGNKYDMVLESLNDAVKLL